MPFIRDYEILLHKSSNYISKITCNNNLEISNLSCKGNLISKSTLLPGKFSFLDLHFDINVNDDSWKLIDFEEFNGSSHEKITREIYRRTANEKTT